MKHKFARVVAAAIVLTLASLPGVAQQTQNTKKKFTSASLDGATGLFHTWDAETLKQGEFNLSFGFDYTNRDPGRMIYRRAPVAFSLGVFNRLEVFVSAEFQKSVGASGIDYYRLVPGDLPQPATTQLGAPYFNNQAPFVDVPRASGFGDVRFGGIFNAVSERRGQPLGVSFAGFMKVPSNTYITYMNRGLTNSANEGGFAVLLSKRIGSAIALHLNLGGNFPGDVKHMGATPVELQNSFLYRGGVAFPVAGMFQVIAELNGVKYSGRNNALNPKSPLDGVIGFKVYPKEWIAIGGGYQAHFNRVTENKANGILTSGVNGFVAQVALARRIHKPPVVSCAISPQQVTQGEMATMRANVVVEQGTSVSYTWTTSGGKLSGSGDTATFDSTGVAPGKYTITVTVSDEYGHSVPCSSEITVNKKYLPPTVTCEPSSTSIMVGESATIRAIGNSPDGSPLTYSWTVNGQPLAATTPTITFGSEGRQPGDYNIAVTVNTGKFTATCSSTVTVRPKPVPPPTIECLTSSVDIESGGTAELRVRAAVPDGSPVTVTWASTGGTVSGSGQTATFNGTGLSAGTYTVTATADNGHGLRASCTMTVNVSQRINVPGFGVRGTRVNNEAKAILDNIAVQMKNDPRLRATVVGYTDDSTTEKRVKDLGQRRAQAVIDYLVSKGVDASRLTATDGGVSTLGDNKTAAGRKENRRAEVRLGVR